MDPALEDVGHQLLDVRADRRRPAGDGDVAVIGGLRVRYRLLLRYSHAADRAARPSDAHRHVRGLLMADALEDGVRAETAREREHSLEGLLSALAHHSVAPNSRASTTGSA